MVMELLAAIVAVRERRYQRGMRAGQAVSQDEMDMLEMEWLQARLEFAREKEKRDAGPRQAGPIEGP